MLRELLWHAKRTRCSRRLLHRLLHQYCHQDQSSPIRTLRRQSVQRGPISQQSKLHRPTLIETVSPVTVLPNAPTAHGLPLVALTGAAGEEPGVVRGSDGEASFHAQGTDAAAVEPSSTQEGGEQLTERSRRDSGLRKLTLPVRFSLG